MSKRFIPRGARRRLKRRFGDKVYRQYSQNSRVCPWPIKSATDSGHLPAAFLWLDTPQGPDYWAHINARS